MSYLFCDNHYNLANISLASKTFKMCPFVLFVIMSIIIIECNNNFYSSAIVLSYRESCLFICYSQTHLRINNKTKCKISNAECRALCAEC